MNKISSFEDLEVYQKAIDFVVEIYKECKKGALNKDYGLSDQLKRATVSISNNIAEGFEYQNNKQFVRFLFYAKGSSGEVRNLLNIIKKIGYIEEERVNMLVKKNIEISKQLANFIKYLNKN